MALPQPLDTHHETLDCRCAGRRGALPRFPAPPTAALAQSVQRDVPADVKERSGWAADIYAAIAPQLLRILDSTSRTGATVTRQSTALTALLRALQQTSDTTRTYLARNAVPLDQALALLRPTTTTLARYAPVFPCLFASLNQERIAEAAGMHLRLDDDRILGLLRFRHRLVNGVCDTTCRHRNVELREVLLALIFEEVHYLLLSTIRARRGSVRARRRCP